jgi:hypothetical protein
VNRLHRIQKYNKNHGKDGRFVSGSGDDGIDMMASESGRKLLNSMFEAGMGEVKATSRPASGPGYDKFLASRPHISDNDELEAVARETWSNIVAERQSVEDFNPRGDASGDATTAWEVAQAADKFLRRSKRIHKESDVNFLHRIQKYNKNHSPKDGRFTSGAGGSGSGPKPDRLAQANAPKGKAQHLQQDDEDFDEYVGRIEAYMAHAEEIRDSKEARLDPSLLEEAKVYEQIVARATKAMKAHRDKAAPKAKKPGKWTAAQDAENKRINRAESGY